MSELPPVIHNRLAYLRFYCPPLADRDYSGGWKARKLNRWILTLEDFVMPSKAKKTGKARSGFTTVFVNFKLTQSDKADFRDFMGRGDEKVVASFIQAMGKGLKFSISENAEQGFYLASATCRDETSINYDHCITSRASDWWEAIIMNVYKAEKLGYDQPWADMADDEDWG